MNEKNPSIAIDGPAGSGKSTVARLVASGIQNCGIVLCGKCCEFRKHR